MKETYTPSPNYHQKQWYLIDASDQTLGRLATTVSKILTGKLKPQYTPHLDLGDYVIIINAEKIKVSGTKQTAKLYYRHSGRPGGMKTENFKSLITKKPERIIETAIRGMLPKGTLGRKMYKKLKVYKGNEHPHSAQTPSVYALDTKSNTK